MYRVDAVNQQAIAIAEIDQAGNHCRAGFGVEDQTGRIVFTTNAEVLYVEDRFLFHRDGRAHFQHVRAEHQIVAFLEVVGVILHK